MSNLEKVKASSFTNHTLVSTVFVDQKNYGIEIIEALPKSWLSRFSHRPFVTPHAINLPTNVPLANLFDKGNKWTSTIYSDRIMLQWNKTSEAEDNKNEKDFFSETSKMLVEIKSAFDLRVNRISGIIRRYCLNENPSFYLSRHFCQEDKWKDKTAPIHRTENFELNSHKTFSLKSNIMVNSWIKNKAGILSDGRKIISVEQDINTLADNKKGFDDDYINNFYSTLPEESFKILSLYYD